MRIGLIVFCIFVLMCCLIKSAEFQQGKLTVLTGPMYAEKTARLIEFIKQSRLNGLRVAVYSHCLDARKDNKLCSRALPTEEIDAIKTGDACDVIRNFMHGDYNCVAIDEVQFFGPLLCAGVQGMLDCNAQVCVAGLDMNFKGQPFGSTIGMLCAMSNEVIKLKTRCSICGLENATMTQRLVNGRPANKNDEELVIEGSDTIRYEPRCRHCHKLISSPS